MSKNAWSIYHPINDTGRSCSTKSTLMRQFYSSVENYIPLAVKNHSHQRFPCMPGNNEWGIQSLFSVKFLLLFTMPINPTKLSFKSGLKELSCIRLFLWKERWHAMVCRFIWLPHTTAMMAGNDDFVCVRSHKPFQFTSIHSALDLTFCPSACYTSTLYITGIQKKTKQFVSEFSVCSVELLSGRPQTESRGVFTSPDSSVYSCQIGKYLPFPSALTSHFFLLVPVSFISASLCSEC